MAGPRDKSIPGVSGDIFKDFVEKTLTYVSQDSPKVIKSTFKGKHQFFGFIYPGLGEVECEITEEGEVLVHWGPAVRSKLKCTMALADFDDVMLDKLNPTTVLMTKKAKLEGSMTEAMKFIGFLPALKKAYKKARKEIGQKYDLPHMA